MQPHRQRLVVAPGGGALSVDTRALLPRDDEMFVLVPEFVGVCGTDLDIIAGWREDEAVVLGHEAIVHLESQPSPARGETLCGNSYIINPVSSENQNEIIGHSLEGMFQEVAYISASKFWDGLLVPIHPGLDPLPAVLSEPLGVAVYSIELLSTPQLPERLLIVGAGPMGLLTAVAARLAGVPEVSLVDRSERRVQYAVDSGILDGEFALCPHSSRFPPAATYYSESGPDAAALCVGREQRREALVDLLRVAQNGARIDLTTGFATREELSQIPGADLNLIRRLNVCGRPWPGYIKTVRTSEGKIIHLTGHRGTSRHHLVHAMNMMMTHPQILGQIVTDVVTLEEATGLIRSLLRERREPDGAPYRKVVVSLGGS